MGLAFELVFKDTVGFTSFMTFMTGIVMRLGIFIVFPLVFASMASGTASLTRKAGRTGFTWLTTIFWALLTSAVFACVGVVVFRFFPAAFPVTSTVPKSAEQAAVIYQELSASTAQRLQAANPLSINAFFNLVKSSDCLLPVLFTALIFGYAIRPTTEIIRPIYITMNSLSEAMFRLARNVARLLWIAIFFISGTWFDSLWKDGTVFVSWRFIVMICIAAIGTLLIVLPLVYAIATGFRRNPYRQILRLFSAGAAAFFSNNYLFSQSPLYTDCRINLGIQKSIVSTTLPIHSIITKGGSALVATLCSCSLIYALNGSAPTVVQAFTIAIACTLASYICCLHAGGEVVFATAFALGLLKVNVSGAEFAIIGLLPLLNGVATMFDIFLAGLGASFTACHLKADCYIRDRDNV